MFQAAIFFLIFSFSLFYVLFFVLFKNEIRPYGFDLAWESPMVAIKDPYQYKNRGQNFLLATRAAWGRPVFHAPCFLSLGFGEIPKIRLGEGFNSSSFEGLV